MTTAPSATQYVESKYWKFRHEKFKQGRPDLLALIKKSVGGGGGDPGASDVDKPNDEVIDELKQEIKVLEDSTLSMRREISDLRSLVESLVQLQQQQPGGAAGSAAVPSSIDLGPGLSTAPVSAFGSLSMSVSDQNTNALTPNGGSSLPQDHQYQHLSTVLVDGKRQWRVENYSAHHDGRTTTVASLVQE
jgi:hypothetical protein